VLHLAEDTKGVIYQSQLSNTPLAHETWELAHDGFLGTSYGYEPIQYDFASISNRKVRRLLIVMAHEISSVTFPANPYASAIAKSGGMAYASIEEADQDMQRLMLALKTSRELAKSLEERQQVIKGLAYDVQVWFNGMDAIVQRSQPVTSRQNTALKDSIARLDDFFNDADLMLR
jgi:phage head maturation protease